MKELIDYINEGILGNADDVLSQGDDEVMKLHILEQLHDLNLYYYNPYLSDDKIFNIFKNRGRWIVDVKGAITCYCTKDGELTDGTFKFGSIDGSFNVFREDDEDCPCTSFKYRPTTVYGDLYITKCPKLKDLKGCPRIVFGDLTINKTGLTTLKYFPITCKHLYLIENKDLKTTKGARRCDIKGCITAVKNGFTSDIEVFKEIGWLKNYNAVHTFDNSALAKCY